MNNNRLGALALILGTISGIVTMIFHPSGGVHRVTPDEFEKLIVLLVAVHVLAIAGLPFSFLGGLALSRRIDSFGPISIAAAVIYGFSLVALMAAATMSGLVTPTILRHMVDHSAASEQWHLLMDYNHAINQGFAQIGAVGSCLAIALWSVIIVARRSLSPALGIFGILLGVAIVICIFAGALNLELHGARLITFCQSIWFIVAGVLFGDHLETNLRPRPKRGRAPVVVLVPAGMGEEHRRRSAQPSLHMEGRPRVVPK